MAFRDDLEAAKRRLAVLEEELGRARNEAAEGEAAKARVAELEAELAALRKEAEPEPEAQPPEERAKVDMLLRRHARDERRGYTIAAVVAAVAGYALAAPHQTGSWLYVPAVMLPSGLGGAYFLYAWRDRVDWTEMVGPVLGLLFGGLILLGTVRLKGEERVGCLARRSAEKAAATAYDARVRSVERLEGVEEGASCTLDVAFAHDPEEICSKRCDVTLRCGERIVLEEAGVAGCYLLLKDGTLHIERAPAADAVDPPIGIELTLDAEGRGEGVVYHDPGKGRMPWRLELAFGKSLQAQ